MGAARRRARLHPLPILVGLIVLVAAAAGIAAMAPRGTASPVAQVWSVVTSAAPEATATPAFASFRKVPLLLPVPVQAITVIAFHQSSFPDTYKMTPLVPIRSTSSVKKQTDAERASGATRVTVAGPQADADGVWNGWALEVWRTNVNGKMDSCLDCGAPPGTPVFAPLSGTVMRVRSYKLYHKYPDFEIQIKADAWNDVDVMILHVTDPLVAEGDRVVAGVTRVASVRDLASTVSGLQLRSYTTEGGNHTHIQLTKVPKPTEVWQLGQDPPGFVRHGS
jgi:murein DD-endopeptidase MepM/ murein hydrolase activator NlpD